MDRDDIMWWFSQEEKALLKEVTQFADENIEEAEIYHIKKEVPWPLIKKIAEKGYF